MGRSRLIAATVVTMAVGVFTAAPALAVWQPSAFVELKTSKANPGDTVSFSGQVLAPDGGECLVELGEVLLVGANCTWDAQGVISGAFVVPDDTETGITATVSVCWRGCFDDFEGDPPAYWQANTALDIVAPFVEVPDVICLSAREATAELTAAGWQDVRVDDRVDYVLGDVVTDQEPEPGAFLQQAVPIVLFLYGTSVPNLVGSTYQEARVTLEERCLELSAVGGITDGTVELQEPGVAALVPGGTTVSVTMSGPTPSPTPSTATASPATSSPPTLATTGTGPDPGSDSDPVSFPVMPTALVLALLVALLVGLLVASGVLARMIQRYRGAGWVTAHVTVTPRPGPGATFAIRPNDERDRDHVITVVPEEVGRSTAIEESPS